MTIKSFSIKNFKAIHELDLSVKGVNVLVGANSIGKSSLIHSLLAAHQCFLSQGAKFINLGGGLVNFGDADALIHTNNSHQAESISFTLETETSKVPNRLKSRSTPSAYSFEPTVNTVVQVELTVAGNRASSTHEVSDYAMVSTYLEEPDLMWFVFSQDDAYLTYQMADDSGNKLDVAYLNSNTVYFPKWVVYLSAVAVECLAFDLNVPQKIHPRLANYGQDLFWQLLRVVLKTDKNASISDSEREAYARNKSEGSPLLLQEAYSIAKAVAKGIEPSFMVDRPFSAGDFSEDDPINELGLRLESALTSTFRVEGRQLIPSSYEALAFSVDYLGPLRKLDPQEQSYFRSPSLSSRIGAAGQHLAFELEKSSNLKIESQYFPVGDSPTGGGSVIEAVNSWLSHLGMKEQISVRSVAGFEPRLEVGGKTFNQVGTGYSQIVPVIAQALLGTHRPKENLLILVEQPELHLHPDLQAKLADFFLTITSGSKGRVKFVVESHSEYLITRLRLLVARGDFDPEDLSIVFFEAGQGSDCMVVSQSTVGDGGNLTYWPTGFSDAAILDKYELAAIQHSAKGQIDFG